MCLKMFFLLLSSREKECLNKHSTDDWMCITHRCKITDLASHLEKGIKVGTVII